MLHPNTTLKFISPEVGSGVFATAFIPAGTIMHVSDLLEIKITPDSHLLQDPFYKDIILKYAYTEPDGTWILSWDLAKYVNHCCHSNLMTTAFGFDIAVRDIMPGDEITDEYGLFCFHKEEEMDLICSHSDECRKRLKVDDIDHYSVQWDEQVKSALNLIQSVPQPLLSYMDADTRRALTAYLHNQEAYPSVYSLKYVGAEA